MLRNYVAAAVWIFYFADGVMPPGINDTTTMVLIPEGNDPTKLKEFRPRSLCNVIYKVVSKSTVNRMRQCFCPGKDDYG